MTRRKDPGQLAAAAPTSAERLRAEAEYRAAREDALGAAGAAGAAELAARHAAEELRHELHVHEIELDIQNEELRRTQLGLERARDRYVDLYDHAPVGYLTLDRDGRVLQLNLTGAALFGADRDQLLGSPFARHVAPDHADRWHRFAAGLTGTGNSSRIDLALQRDDGGGWHAQLDALRVEEPDAGSVLRITLTDISDRKHADADLRLAAAAFEAQEGIMITDAAGVIERVNTAFSRITGYSAAEAVGTPARLLASGRHDAEFFAAMWQSLREQGAWQGEVWNRRRGGEVYPLWLGITAVRGDGPGGRRYVSTMVDISQRKAREETIAQLAFFDPLTNLPNRRLMKDRLHVAMTGSAVCGREGALMFIDFDHFKRVNDTLGHDMGDQLLHIVAQRLAGCLRETDTVCRPGGDEFVVILPAETPARPAGAAPPVEAAARARSVAEHILRALSQPYQIAGKDYRGSVSIGITLFDGQRRSMDDLLKCADQAMYQAKAAGRNTLRFFDASVQQVLDQRSTLEADLRQAVAENQFELYFQSEVDRDGRLSGVEVLIRWQHPRRGLLLPDEFIGVAEETGLIHPLGSWVLGEACAYLASWADDPALAALRLSVNVSPCQFRDARFVDNVLQLIARSGAPADRLALELTEGVMLDDVADTIARMTALRASGVGFSLDDFGTGYASMTYLKRLPIDRLKIDRSFVRDVLTDLHDAAIASTIVTLGRNLGLSVVAEGVETAAQRDLLAGFGCHAFQGDLYGRPAPLAQLREALARLGAGTLPAASGAAPDTGPGRPDLR